MSQQVNVNFELMDNSGSPLEISLVLGIDDHDFAKKISDAKVLENLYDYKGEDYIIYAQLSHLGGNNSDTIAISHKHYITNLSNGTNVLLNDIYTSLEKFGSKLIEEGVLSEYPRYVPTKIRELIDSKIHILKNMYNQERRISQLKNSLNTKYGIGQHNENDSTIINAMKNSIKKQKLTIEDIDDKLSKWHDNFKLELNSSDFTNLFSSGREFSEIHVTIGVFDEYKEDYINDEWKVEYIIDKLPIVNFYNDVRFILDYFNQNPLTNNVLRVETIIIGSDNFIEPTKITPIEMLICIDNNVNPLEKILFSELSKYFDETVLPVDKEIFYKLTNI